MTPPALQLIEGDGRYGAVSSVINAARALQKWGLDVEYGVFAGRSLAPLMRELGFKVREIPARRKVDFKGIAALVRLLRTGEFGVLHTHMSKATTNGSIAGRLARVPVVSTVHGLNKKYTYQLANHLITVSDAGKKFLVDQGMPVDRITTVYNCIDLDVYRQVTCSECAKRELGLDPARPVIGTVARAHQLKGVDTALQVVAQVRKRGIDADYLFVGAGKHLDEFKQQAIDLGIASNCHFVGFVPDVTKHLAAMDLFLFPTRREAFGISLLEAMATGVPVVASAVDGVPEVLGADGGIAISEPTIESLTGACALLLGNEDRRDKLIAGARSRVERLFSGELTAKGIGAVYEALAARDAVPKAVTP